ncbi:hypothetical protein J7M23_04625 [Candidatus Sumerlaeota bacterium]|nr:hypothetical protein [Candidatus Sumerlaeota bacterium]
MKILVFKKLPGLNQLSAPYSAVLKTGQEEWIKIDQFPKQSRPLHIFLILPQGWAGKRERLLFCYLFICINRRKEITGD